MAWVWYQRVPDGLWHKREAAAVFALHHGGAFFMRAVHIGRNVKAMPVHHFRVARFVYYLYRDRLAFGHAEQRPRNLPVVRKRLDRVTVAQVKIDFTNPKRDIRAWQRNGLRERCGQDGRECATRHQLAASHFAISPITSADTLPGMRYSAGDGFPSPAMNRWFNAG